MTLSRFTIFNAVQNPGQGTGQPINSPMPGDSGDPLQQPSNDPLPEQRPEDWVTPDDPGPDTPEDPGEDDTPAV